jgi:hypothetical protein
MADPQPEVAALMQALSTPEGQQQLRTLLQVSP